MATATDALPEIINAIVDFGTENITSLLEIGNTLLSSILILMIAWNGIKLVMNNNHYTVHITTLLSLIFLWSFAYYALHNYTYLTQNINNGFNDIIIRGLHINSGLLYQNFATMLDALRLMTKYVSIPSDQLSSSTQIIKNLSEIHTGFIIQSLSTGLLALSIALCFAVYAEGQVLFCLSILIGPIMIPWLLFPPLAFLAFGWLRLIVIAGLYKLFCLLILAILAPAFKKILEVASEVETKSGIGNDTSLGLLHLGGSLITICLALLLLKLMWNIPKIAILVTQKNATAIWIKPTSS